MLVRCFSVLVLVLFLAAPAHAQFPLPIPTNATVFQPLDYWQPENGWWIIEDRPGTGFSMERQGHPTFGDIIFMAVFTYDEAGAPTFYTASLRYDPVARRASEVFTRTRNGQVFDDPDYRFPDVDFGVMGDAVFEFDTPTTGRWISTNQGPVRIERQDFGYGNRVVDRMTGRWVIVYVDRSVTIEGYTPPPNTYTRDVRSYIIDFDLQSPRPGPENLFVFGRSPIRPFVSAEALRVANPQFPDHPIQVTVFDGLVALRFHFRDGIDYLQGRWTVPAALVSFPGSAYAFRLGTRNELDLLIDGPPLP